MPYLKKWADQSEVRKYGAREIYNPRKNLKEKFADSYLDILVKENDYNRNTYHYTKSWAG